jgi:hypothetical protein
MRKLIFTLPVLVGDPLAAQAQGTDTTRVPSFFQGQITATNNGISLIPKFSLSRPAVFLDLSMGLGRLSFDPMFRFGMDARPWVFVFWLRYKRFAHPKFTASVGAHPSFLFQTQPSPSNGGAQVMTTQRYFAVEATPTYHFNQYLGVGLYYLGGHGLTPDLIQYTHFVALRALATKVPLGRHFTGTVVPQVFYLYQDGRAGTYWNVVLELAKNRFPVSINANLSQTIRTQIVGKEFLWSVGLVYNINQTYRRVE